MECSPTARLMSGSDISPMDASSNSARLLSPGRTRVRTSPASVYRTISSWGASSRQRAIRVAHSAPFPHIGARPPSLLKKWKRMLSGPDPGSTMPKPSAPIPFLLSQADRMFAELQKSTGVTRPSTNTKSLPEPVILQTTMPFICDQISIETEVSKPSIQPLGRSCRTFCFHHQCDRQTLLVFRRS